MSKHVTLPDGNDLEVDDDASGAAVAAAIGSGLARAALAIDVDGELRDLSREVPDGAHVAIVTGKSDQALALIRHDAAHVLAAAVMELYPGTRISIGPAIDAGFYYDFD
ncbi:MAG TPA: TGS domain-containing protein, partial [Solirubrobacteraceae bacterium]|nr:TGS domain-containing protein [Solirubrobacteraceae bacterium]